LYYDSTKKSNTFY